MRKLCKRVMVCVGISMIIVLSVAIFDRQKLNDSLIRFHVVANSDAENDQSVKLLVRDAILQSMQRDLASIADAEQAKKYLQENLPKIEDLANSVLKAAGFEDHAVATICKEAFAAREYDTFTLPAGVYEALRIVIGEGEGNNWWCVTFPSLCMGATTEEFTQTASQAGFPDRITDSLVKEEDYTLHFYLLDLLGKAEACFFPG